MEDFDFLIILAVIVEEFYRLFVRYSIHILLILLGYLGFFKNRRPKFIWKIKETILSKIISKELNRTLKLENTKKAQKLYEKNALQNVKSTDPDEKIIGLQQLSQSNSEYVFQSLYGLLKAENDDKSKKLIIITLYNIIKNIEENDSKNNKV